jgi:hypothetical protein
MKWFRNQAAQPPILKRGKEGIKNNEKMGSHLDLDHLGSHPAQNLQKRCSVFVIGHNGTAFVAPGEQMI